MIWHDMTWHYTTWHDMIWHDMTWHDMISHQNHILVIVWMTCMQLRSCHSGDMTWHYIMWYNITWHDMTARRKHILTPKKLINSKYVVWYISFNTITCFLGPRHTSSINLMDLLTSAQKQPLGYRVCQSMFWAKVFTRSSCNSYLLILQKLYDFYRQ